MLCTKALRNVWEKLVAPEISGKTSTQQARKQNRERSAVENAEDAIPCSPWLADFLPSMILSCGSSTLQTRTLATLRARPGVQGAAQVSAGWLVQDAESDPS